jgi:hypothetical protein
LVEVEAALLYHQAGLETTSLFTVNLPDWQED